MTYNFCAADDLRLCAGPVEHEVWQVRARNAGLNQRALSKLAGVAENTISRQMRGLFGGGVPNYLKTIIRAWELLDDEQRERLRAASESNDDRR